MNLRDLLILTRVAGIGPNRLRSLVNHFGDVSLISSAGPPDFAAVEGIDRKSAMAVVNFFRGGVPADASRYADDQLTRMARVEGRIVTYWDAAYPANLKRIYDSPPLLFARGELSEKDNSSVAVVGTRNPSGYGQQVAERFARGLAELGIPVISGLARGIDTIAHHAAVRAGGRTVAVIGSGIDVIYPPENRQLVENIEQDGAVISECEMGAKPDAGNFPRRNRIISGIAVGTLIVETGTDGGAMITASSALEQNREIFAIPSGIHDKKKSGTNLLIREGKAILTESVDDILAELAPRLKALLAIPGHPLLARPPEGPPPDLTLFEKKVFDSLGENPIHIDPLAQRTGLATGDLLVHLLSLEFKGLVRQLAGKMFLRH